MCCFYFKMKVKFKSRLASVEIGRHKKRIILITLYLIKVIKLNYLQVIRGVFSCQRD